MFDVFDAVTTDNNSPSTMSTKETESASPKKLSVFICEMLECNDGTTYIMSLL